ncbi:biotin/lipoyl-containing protein [Streptomyces sp. NPDC000888]
MPKRVGEHVEADEPLLKVSTEIPSTASGVLPEITVTEDETDEVGAALAVFRTPDEAPSVRSPRLPHGRRLRSTRLPGLELSLVSGGDPGTYRKAS